MTRCEYPNVNDAIVDRQRQIGGSVLVACEPQKPDGPGGRPSSLARVTVKRVRRDFAPVVEVVQRASGRIPELERKLVLAYNTPNQKDDAFLIAARELAEALMGTK